VPSTVIPLLALAFVLEGLLLALVFEMDFPELLDWLCAKKEVNSDKSNKTAPAISMLSAVKEVYRINTDAIINPKAISMMLRYFFICLYISPIYC
jgi:hypothetical protein